MGRKCDAGIIKNLTLRGQTYYYRMDFKNSDGRRRAFRRSLHTSDFCNAVAMINKIKKQEKSMASIDILSAIFKETSKLDNEIAQGGNCFDLLVKRDCLAKMANNMLAPLQKAQLGDSFPLYGDADRPIPTNPVAYFTNPGQMTQHAASADTVPDYTIAKMIEAFCCKTKQTSDKHIKVVGQRLYELVQMADLSPEDDFAKLLTHDTVAKIVNGVMAKQVNNDTKNTTFGRFKRLADFAVDLCGDKYSKRALTQIPKLPDPPKADTQGYVPFTITELKAMFSRDCTFFDYNPDMFWGCCIGLFTGSRITAAFTLMVHNIKTIDGIPCFEIIKDHPWKELKTDDTERTIPVPPQMQELGFLEHVDERKKQLTAEDEDFLLPVIKTAKGTKNGKIGDDINDWLAAVGIKQRDEKGHCGRTGKSFHSFRDTASIQMQKARLPKTQINAIIGWKGEGTMETNYSKYQLSDLLDAMKKYNYDEIMPELKYWADRLRGKFGRVPKTARKVKKA